MLIPRETEQVNFSRQSPFFIRCNGKGDRVLTVQLKEFLSQSRMVDISILPSDENFIISTFGGQEVYQVFDYPEGVVSGLIKFTGFTGKVI